MQNDLLFYADSFIILHYDSRNQGSILYDDELIILLYRLRILAFPHKKTGQNFFHPVHIFSLKEDLLFT